jgi:Ca2+-binding RTX toxin-like protein
MAASDDLYINACLESDGRVEFRGGAGIDTLIGGFNGDTLKGGAGDDQLNGRDGADVIDGGDGFDTASYIASKAGVTVNLNLTTAQVSAGHAGGDILSNIEDIMGSELADVMIGNSGNNTLTGRNGNDSLQGGAGDDRLVGSGGADRLEGGMGQDTMLGGTGADVFVFNSIAETLTTDRDFIGDFSRSQHDRIDLSAIDADVVQAGDQGFTLVSAFSGHAGELRFNGGPGGNTILWGDVDGDMNGDFSIQLTGNHTLIAGDFLL